MKTPRLIASLAVAAVVAATGFVAAGPATAAEKVETAAGTVISATPAASGDLRPGDTLRVFVAIDGARGAGVV